jgi:hypothetical protein
VEDDASHRDDDVDAQCEQPFAQSRHLGARTGGTRGAQPEFLHQDIRGGREEHAELIGPKAPAARAAEVEPVVEFLDPVFDVAARSRSARRRSGGSAGES